MIEFSVISPLEKNDAAELVRLQNQSTGTPWTLEMAENLLHHSSMQGWCLRRSNSLLGFIVSQYTEISADIVEFVIDEPYRRQGFGHKLYQVMENHCTAIKVKEIFLEVSEINLPARGFYEKKGLMVIGIRPEYYLTSNGKISAILMKKQLV